MHDRALQRQEWVRRLTGLPTATLQAATADASFRSYWRVEAAALGGLLMDSPPALDDPLVWLDIGRRLADAGLHVPKVYAADLEQGWLWIEDLGSRLYLSELNPQTVDHLYRDAMHALLQIQTQVDCTGMALYDRAFLQRELEILPEWYLGRHLGLATETWQAQLQPVFDALLANAAEQPQGFVHRDYHSRNLIYTEHANPGLIDFQGALLGPITYDLASLLRDCYIRWPQQRVHAWVETHRQDLIRVGRLDPKISSAQFLRWFDLTGLQRHLKVLGIFCRLAYRDGKTQYLHDLPLVYDYVREVAANYPELKQLSELPSPTVATGAGQ